MRAHVIAEQQPPVCERTAPERTNMRRKSLRRFKTLRLWFPLKNFLRLKKTLPHGEPHPVEVCPLYPNIAHGGLTV